MGFIAQRRVAATAGLILTATLPLATSAQVIVKGVLYDDATGLPIRGTVMLVNPANDAAVVNAPTDSLGQFILQASTGTYQIAAVRAGYTSILSAPIPFASGERMTVRIPIAEVGDPQHHIGVLEHVRPDAAASRQAADSRRSLAETGFQGRKALGTGLHYDRSELANAHVNTLGEFLSRVPGLKVVDAGSASSMQMSRSTGLAPVSRTSSSSARCHVGWFVDGRRTDMPGRTDPLTDALGTMQLDAIEGIEVFRGLSEMPAEFAAPDLVCGAVSIWTRRS